MKVYGKDLRGSREHKFHTNVSRVPKVDLKRAGE